MKKLLSSLAILVLFLSVQTQAHAQTNRILDSVVMVILPNGNNEITAYGTGFFISPFGHILTSAHVIQGGKLFQVCFRYPEEAGVICYDSDRLKLLAKDSYLDLALLQLPQIPNAYNNNFLILGNSDSSQVGDEINILGYPDSDFISQTLTKGLITEFFPGLIFTDAQLFFGNSGSPALNNKNQVIGIAAATFGDYDNSTGILIPSNAIKNWLISIRFNPQNPTNHLMNSIKLQLLKKKTVSTKTR